MKNQVKLYQLISQDPRFSKFGTAKEIWEHVQTEGYSGKTVVVDGFPLPYGDDFAIESGHIKRTSSLRLSHSIWATVDELIENMPGRGFKTRVDVIIYAVEKLFFIQEHGKYFATTPEGIKEFDTILEVLELSPYFKEFDFQPVISKDRNALEESIPPKSDKA